MNTVDTLATLATPTLNNTMARSFALATAIVAAIAGLSAIVVYRVGDGRDLVGCFGAINLNDRMNWVVVDCYVNGARPVELVTSLKHTQRVLASGASRQAKMAEVDKLIADFRALDYVTDETKDAIAPVDESLPWWLPYVVDRDGLLEMATEAVDGALRYMGEEDPVTTD